MSDEASDSVAFNLQILLSTWILCRKLCNLERSVGTAYKSKSCITAWRRVRVAILVCLPLFGSEIFVCPDIVIGDSLQLLKSKKSRAAHHVGFGRDLGVRRGDIRGAGTPG